MKHLILKDNGTGIYGCFDSKSKINKFIKDIFGDKRDDCSASPFVIYDYTDSRLNNVYKITVYNPKVRDWTKWGN